MQSLKERVSEDPAPQQRVESPQGFEFRIRISGTSHIASTSVISLSPSFSFACLRHYKSIVVCASISFV